jgi:hypothetical protein
MSPIEKCDKGLPNVLADVEINAFIKKPFSLMTPKCSPRII